MAYDPFEFIATVDQYLASHQFLDEVARAMDCEIAARLRADPEGVRNRARDVLARWSRRGGFSAGEQLALDEWAVLLDALDVERLARLLEDDSQEAARLRQSSPFTGILTPAERRRVWNACEASARHRCGAARP
jgi:hypothetical protein